MPLTSALLFVLDGLALTVRYGNRLFHLFQIIVFGALFIALLGFSDFLYGGVFGQRLIDHIGLNTSIAACLLNLGILCLDQEHGMAAAIRRSGLSGAQARRLFPAAILAPLFLGWVSLHSERIGLYGREFNLAVLTSSIAVIILFFIWLTTEALWRLELADMEAKKELNKQALLIDHSNDAIITMDAGRCIRSWNRGAEELYGWAASEAMGQVIHEFLETTSSVTVADIDRVLLETGRWDGELVYTRRDGKRITVDSRQVLQRGENGEVVGVLEINRDITASKQMELQLRQAQKLESVGQLAGGVAHDFNNILTVVGGYASMLLTEPALSEWTHEAAQEIVTATDRAAAIARQLLAFSRRQPNIPRHVRLIEIVVAIERMLRRLIGETIDLVLELNNEAVVVCIDPSHLEQVIMNLVINARDAMPNGGKILIETGQFLVDAEYSATHLALKPGDYAVLSVTDTGIGMSAATKARIFEPFFTTKESGRGTGLGLSTVYGIIEQNKGSITVYSELGKGTTFKILLPAVEGPVTRLGSEPMPRVRAGTETILLAEDEEPLRNYIRRVLERNGYKVLVAAGGGEALRIAARYHTAIELLLTDVMMPEMGGMNLADHFARLYPRIRILHMSGYSDRLWTLESGTNFIQKPFTAASLLTKIQSILESH
ncbi:MAG: PAS domain S-box protein [Acidobacteriia bacterium]|nr:PAS domain S-box protein [Terriglobia bacterium]